jgi:glucosamine-6-phosphate deaminase
VRITVAADGADVAARAADWIEENAAPDTFATLAVGASVSATYEELSRRPGCLHDVDVMSLDELHPLPFDDSRTFGGQLHRQLGPDTGMRLHRFNSAAPDPLAEAQRVDGLLAERRISACVLGLGPNGHLAFNEPDEPFDAPSRAVTLRAGTLAHLGGPAAIAPATGAMTLGLPTLLRAERVLLVVLGDKRAALAKLLLGPLTTRLPASILRAHPDVSVLCTPREAADIPAAVLAVA